MVISDLLYRQIKSTPEFLRCVGFDQNNPHHHLPVDLHMEAAMAFVEGMAPWSQELSLAALVHDIAKPACKIVDKKTGVFRFFGHAKASAEMVKDILSRLEVRPEMANIVVWLVLHHDDFISFKKDCRDNDPFLRKITVENVAEVIAKSFIVIESETPKDIDVNATVRSIVTGAAPSWGKVLPWKRADGFLPFGCFADLLLLCKADAMAQKEVVYNRQGEVLTTSAEKMDILENIEKVLPDAYNIAVKSVKGDA